MASASSATRSHTGRDVDDFLALVTANQHQVSSRSGRFEMLMGIDGACITNSDTLCGLAACSASAKATANLPGFGPDHCSVECYARMTCALHCGSECRKRHANVRPDGQAALRAKKRASGGDVRRSEQGSPVPVSIHCSRDSDWKIQGKSLVFSHRISGQQGPTLRTPSRQERFPPLPANRQCCHVHPTSGGYQGQY